MASYSILASARAKDAEAGFPAKPFQPWIPRTPLWLCLVTTGGAVAWVACSCSIIMLVRRTYSTLQEEGSRAVYLARSMISAHDSMCAHMHMFMQNRHLLVSLHFHYPFALSAWGQILSGSLAWLCRADAQGVSVSTKFYLRCGKQAYAHKRLVTCACCRAALHTKRCARKRVMVLNVDFSTG